MQTGISTVLVNGNFRANFILIGNGLKRESYKVGFEVQLLHSN